MSMLDSCVHQKIQFSNAQTSVMHRTFHVSLRGPVIKFDNQWNIWNYMRTNEVTSGAITLCRTPHGYVD